MKILTLLTLLGLLSFSFQEVIVCGHDDEGICLPFEEGIVDEELIEGDCPEDLECFAQVLTSASGIVSAARSMVGKYPYSWGGGDNNGPTKGIKQTISPYCDDRKVKGFDCSGLAKYAVHKGTGVSLPHNAQSQYNQAKSSGKLVALANRKAGDLVFFGSSASSITHVAIYSGNGKMIEASGHNPDCSGILVRERSLRTSKIIGHVARFS